MKGHHHPLLTPSTVFPCIRRRRRGSCLCPPSILAGILPRAGEIRGSRTFDSFHVEACLGPHGVSAWRKITKICDVLVRLHGGCPSYLIEILPGYSNLHLTRLLVCIIEVLLLSMEGDMSSGQDAVKPPEKTGYFVKELLAIITSNEFVIGYTFCEYDVYNKEQCSSKGR